MSVSTLPREYLLSYLTIYTPLLTRYLQIPILVLDCTYVKSSSIKSLKSSVANSQRSASDDAFRWLTAVNQVARWTLAGNIYTLTVKLTARLS